jgi:SAM-dependent methyltransferase
MKILSCPVCADDKHQRNVLGFDARGCGVCGLIYKSEMRTTEELYNYYRYEYYAKHIVDYRRLRNRSIRLCCVIAQFLQRPVQRHLDVGSAEGLLSNAVHTIWGNASFGVELCKEARAQCKGLQQIWETVDDIPQDIESFDLITMSHVLEHISEPMHILTKIRHLLNKKNGHLVLEVPNFSGEPTALPPNSVTSHVLGFTQTSLKWCLNKAGFYIREIQTALPLLSRWGEKAPIYLTAICTAEPMDEIDNAVHRNAVWLDDDSERLTIADIKDAASIPELTTIARGSKLE